MTTVFVIILENENMTKGLTPTSLSSTQGQILGLFKITNRTHYKHTQTTIETTLEFLPTHTVTLK